MEVSFLLRIAPWTFISNIKIIQPFVVHMVKAMLLLRAREVVKSAAVAGIPFEIAK